MHENFPGPTNFILAFSFWLWGANSLFLASLPLKIDEQLPPPPRAEVKEFEADRMLKGLGQKAIIILLSNYIL